MRPGLSIVIPAKDEASQLPATVEALRPYLELWAPAEVVVAVDAASADGTLEVARRLAEADGHLRVVQGLRAGKGNTLRAGVEAAQGSVILLADADLAVDPSQFAGLIEAARRGEVGIASREVAGAKRVGEPRLRFLAGRVFNALVRACVLPGIRDSQCGFKALPASLAHQVVPEVQTGRWVFDVELLALARRRGARITEVPVVVRYAHGSKLRPLRDAGSILADLWGVWRRVGRRRGR